MITGDVEQKPDLRKRKANKYIQEKKKENVPGFATRRWRLSRPLRKEATEGCVEFPAPVRRHRRDLCCHCHRAPLRRKGPRQKAVSHAWLAKYFQPPTASGSGKRPGVTMDTARVSFYFTRTVCGFQVSSRLILFSFIGYLYIDTFKLFAFFVTLWDSAAHRG